MNFNLSHYKNLPKTSNCKILHIEDCLAFHSQPAIFGSTFNHSRKSLKGEVKSNPGVEIIEMLFSASLHIFNCNGKKIWRYEWWCGVEEVRPLQKWKNLPRLESKQGKCFPSHFQFPFCVDFDHKLSVSAHKKLRHKVYLSRSWIIFRRICNLRKGERKKTIFVKIDREVVCLLFLCISEDFKFIFLAFNKIWCASENLHKWNSMMKRTRMKKDRIQSRWTMKYFV